MSGAILREVGTTNKTHLRDYSAAVNENTGAILRVHQSNYRIVGFTSEPSIEEMAQVARERNIPLIDDIGSGALVEIGDFGLEHEPLVQDSVKAGADVVCFSGDKLIGGPQAGVIVGRSAAIERIKKNPLMRALRVDKMTVAAMEATLKLFLDRERLSVRHPSYRMLSATVDSLDARAESVRESLLQRLSDSEEIRVIDGGSMVGSGSVPAQTMLSKVLQVRPAKISAERLAWKLRHHSPPIFARIHEDAVQFDFRTIQPDEDVIVRDALDTLLREEGQ
jgi:L-seryl-tRNA(Ser) seleniumtransferase